MSTDTYAKRGPHLTRVGSGASRLEVVILVATLAIGVGIGFALNSFVLGFAAVVVLAVVARIGLAIGSPKHSRAGRREQARS